MTKQLSAAAVSVFVLSEVVASGVEAVDGSSTGAAAVSASLDGMSSSVRVDTEPASPIRGVDASGLADVPTSSRVSMPSCGVAPGVMAAPMSVGVTPASCNVRVPLPTVAASDSAIWDAEPDSGWTVSPARVGRAGFAIGSVLGRFASRTGSTDIDGCCLSGSIICSAFSMKRLGSGRSVFSYPPARMMTPCSPRIIERRVSSPMEAIVAYGKIARNRAVAAVTKRPRKSRS